MKKIERPLLNVDLLRTFAVIAECGSLTVAAERLGRTQSAISVQLRKLEADLGVALFERARSGMRLTAEGRALMPKARSVLDEVRSVGDFFAPPLRGRVRIGVPDDFDDGALEAILGSFSRDHPGVDIEASSGCAVGYPAALSAGSLDIAVCSGPDDESASAERGETLEIRPTVWACGQSARFDPDAPVPIAVLNRSCWWSKLPFEALEEAGRAYEVVFRSASFASQRAAISAGLAVGAVPFGCLGEKMKTAPRALGLPKLPSARRRIVISDGAPQALAQAMATAIRAARAGA
ncbi:MAG: LysR family transcriptional regulator [Pseudomonadota bacterium]